MEEGEVEEERRERKFHHEQRFSQSTPTSSSSVDNDEIWNFTEAEDERIFENFDEFLKNHEEDEENLLFRIRSTPSEIPDVFWRQMTVGLSRRRLETVKSRIFYIFDKFYDPNEAYDVVEIQRLSQIGLPPEEISRRLRIPLLFVRNELIATSSRSSTPEMSTSRRRIFSESSIFSVLKALYESAKEKSEVFNQSSFDWDVFKIKCTEYGVQPIPSPAVTIRKFEVSWRRAQTEIFVYLEPQPTLRQKLIFIHEAYVRYVCDKKKRKRVRLDMKLTVLFTIVYEFYSEEHPGWKIPQKIKKYEGKVDMKKIETRMEMVREHRKRPRPAETQKFTIKSRIIKSTETPPTVKRLKWIQEDGDYCRQPEEMSSIENDTIEDVSHLETSISFRTDETILAGGGGGRRREMTSSEVNSIQEEEEEDVEEDVNHPEEEEENNQSVYETLIIPEINEKLKKEAEKKKENEESFKINESVDIWSQLVQF